MASEAPVRFVILTEARSGSSLLVSMLRAHPNVVCHGEAFHKRNVAVLPPLDQTTPAVRDADPDAFAERLFASGDAQPDCRAVGFKLFYYHNPGLLYRLMRGRQVRFILLRRDDRLAQYASRQISLRSRRWQLTANGQEGENRRPSPKIRYRLFGHLAHLVFTVTCYRISLWLLRRQSVPVLVVPFETFTEALPDWSGRIQRFLDLPEIETPPGTERQNPKDVFSRFENPDAARRGLAIQRRLLGWWG